ncbi:hypothetical protein [Cohnella cholangitidis]|uniref:hypothetical protein n=1 Tax=Cohnella cholangitidis TaxID=2598458 RepID=UPI0015F78D59|nr:hypothetical protein [Cohnella cholangitidis]
MTQAGDNKVMLSELDKDLLPLNVLLHCRTVVEGKNFVTTGVMTHVEGELFEVELPEFDQFELGETVKLTVYSPAGIQSMPSIVFAKYEARSHCFNRQRCRSVSKRDASTREWKLTEMPIFFMC